MGKETKSEKTEREADEKTAKAEAKADAKAEAKDASDAKAADAAAKDELEPCDCPALPETHAHKADGPVTLAEHKGHHKKAGA